MSSATRSRSSRVCPDDILSSRLRALGYSLERPSAADPAPASTSSAADSDSDDDAPQPAPVKNALQLFVEQVEAEIARMQKRVKEPSRSVKHSTRIDDSSSSGADKDEPPASASSTATPPPSSAARRTLTLGDLLRIVDAHKAAALASKGSKGSRRKAAEEAPPVTPRQERNERDLEALKLNSGRAGPASPQKRRRRPSTPSSPSPPDLVVTPTRSAPRRPSSSTSEASAAPSSPSPRKRATRHLPHILTLLSLGLRLVGAAESPLVTTASRIAALIPSVDFPEIVDLAQSLRGDATLLALSHGRAQASGRTFEASLSFVGDHLFSTSPRKVADPQRATLLLAKELNLYPPRLAAPTSSASSRIISTKRTECAQCRSSLNLPRRPTVPVYLVDRASPASIVYVATHVCSNSSCRAIHTPDHVEITQKGQKVWLWEADAEAFKVGDRVWLSRGFAMYYRLELLNQASSAGSVASTWSEAFSEATPALDDDGAADSSDESEDASSAREDDAPPRAASSGPFILRQKHVWRAFVIYACTLAAVNSLHGRFASRARPLVEDLIALANADLFSSSSLPNDVDVLPPHSCPKCARKPHRWRGGPATEEERAQGVRWAGTHARRGHQGMEPDIELVDGPDVQFAVCDGIEIGHPLCAAPGCRSPPDAYRRRRRFCAHHLDLHLVCGVNGCGQERSDDADDAQDPSEACDNPAHQELWRAFIERRRRFEERGWRGRRFGVARKYALADIDEPPGVEEELQLYSDDDEEELGVNATEEKKPPRRAPMTHTWNIRRTSNLQILVSACGAPLAWTKFADGETASEVSSFLSSIHAQQRSSFPTYIAYDRACHVLRHALTTGSSFPPFLSSTRLLVTGFHKLIHPAADAFCDEFCTPTPLDGNAQDLVVPFRPATRGGEFRHGSSRTFERAFNTSAAEQLNSTLARFSSLLATLRADNFDFLVHLLLRRRREKIEQKM
ncbi:hypothetical protein JCM9279_006685 [Rhodotorula babjevae]